MVSGRARVRNDSNGIELRIGYNEILRQTAIPKNAAALSGKVRGPVEEIRKLTDVAIRKKAPRIGVQTQRLGSGDRCAVHHSHTRDIQSPQHAIEQRRVTAGARDIECVENSILEDVGVIDGNDT